MWSVLIFRAVYFRIPAGSFWGGEIWSWRVSRNQLSQRNPVVPQPHESRERSSHAQAQVSRLWRPSRRTVRPAKWKQNSFTSPSILPCPSVLWTFRGPSVIRPPLCPPTRRARQETWSSWPMAWWGSTPKKLYTCRYDARAAKGNKRDTFCSSLTQRLSLSQPSPSSSSLSSIRSNSSQIINSAPSSARGE